MLRVIKASAGSGKTYTLVKEYLRLALKRPESYFKHILAITFTNKAANEMKERVIQKLYDLSVSSDGEKHLRNYLCNELNIKEEELANRCNVMLNAILHHYTDVSISTIDSFTHQVLRSFAYELKINMHAEIETDYDMVLEQVVNLLMDNIADEKHTENDQEKKYLSRALIEFAFNKMEEGGSWNIDRNLLLFAHNLIRDDTYIYFNSLQDTSVPHLLETQRYLFKIIKQFNEQTKKTAKKALELIEAHQINEDEFYNKNRGIISYFKNVIREGLKYKYAEEGSSNHHITIYENKWYKGKTNPAIDNIKDELSQYFFQLTNAFKTQGRRVRLAKIISKNIFPFMLLKAMDRQLRAYLKENHLLLLHEAQQKVYAEVKDQPAPVIFEKIGSRFNHVMIDEFQDTSVLQWHNLLPLIDHAVTEGNECLLVGDAKQAIYRFRGGEVKQFTMLPEIYGSDKDKILKEREINIKNHGVAIQTLEYNFRSRENIIDFNNKFYEWAQQSNRLANKTAYEGLRQKNGTGKTGGNVTICFTEKKKKGEVNPAHIYTERFIREALNQGYSQRDIAVLCEKNSTAAEIARYLLSCGFQVISPESLLISQAASVKLLESALLYLQNRENLIARAELWNELRGWCKLPPTENFSEVLGSYSYFEEKISSLLGRDFNSDQLVGRKLFDLIIVLMDLFRIDPLTDPFVHFFLDEVLNYSQKYQPGIAQFTDWWEQQQISVTFPESLDAIRLMTVHKSKGLEFPVVILPGANYDVKPKKKDVWVSLELWPELKLKNFLLPLEDSLKKTELSYVYEEEEQELFLEKLNLLYVATTRPTDSLYIICEKEGTFAKLLSEYLQKEKIEPTEQLVYRLYKTDVYDIVKKQDAVPQQMNISYSLIEGFSQRRIFKIRVNERRYWQPRKVSEIEYGILLHDLLNSINSSVEAEEAARLFFNSQNLSDDIKNRLLRDLSNIVHNNKLRHFFVPGAYIFRETQISWKGNLKKPDRVVLNPYEKKVSILEIKTGQADSSHKNQVHQYAEVFEQIGYQVEQALIYYTETQTLVTIAP